LAFTSISSTTGLSLQNSTLVTDILLFAVTSCRISRNRLFGNLVVSLESNFGNSTSSWLRWSAGISGIGDRTVGNEVFGGLFSDSLTRHFGRLTQFLQWSLSSFSVSFSVSFWVLIMIFVDKVSHRSLVFNSTNNRFWNS
jgi:hypothetical protein